MSVPTPAAAMAIRDSLEEEVLIALVRAAWITAAGRALLRRLDRDVADAAKQSLGSLGRTRLTTLRDLLVAFAPPQPSELTGPIALAPPHCCCRSRSRLSSPDLSIAAGLDDA